MSKRKAPPLESPSKRVKPEPTVIKVIRAPPAANPTTPRRAVATYKTRNRSVRKHPSPPVSSSDSDDELDVLKPRPSRAAPQEDSPTRKPAARARGKAATPIKTEDSDADESPLSSPTPQFPDTPTRTLRSGKLTATTSPVKARTRTRQLAPTSPTTAVETSPSKASPRKRGRISTNKLPKTRTPSPVPDSEEEVSHTILETIVSAGSTPNLARCLNAQKREILRALQHPLDIASEGEDSPSRLAFQQLSDLLGGTIGRGEGNSCLLLGSRGSGKTSVVEQCIASLSEPPIVLRLCGWTQHTDKLAMREIAYQLGHQTGKTFLTPNEEQGGEDTIDSPDGAALSMAPSAHLPALISVLPTLARPTIVILDAFDLFAQHPRQSLLYCLLDTVQSCRAGTGTKGLAVIGLTSRVDTLNLLEKRVKSRFSGRMFRTTPPLQSRDWVQIANKLLSCQISEALDETGDWREQWEAGVRSFLSDQKVAIALKETFSVTKDVRVLTRLLTSVVVHLSSSSPFPNLKLLENAVAAQRSRPQFPMLHALPYPGICLLIACVHSETSGHAAFTFEMLYERVRDQIRVSTSAPVQFNGSSVGMPQCSRSVLLSAFESMVSAKIITLVASSSTGMAKEFVKYRAVAGREDIKKALQLKGDVNLTKWFTKATAS